MKVISGSLKGRNILGYQLEGTRPTMDRVKESIFGMIQNHIREAIVLDLFAGTGNLGIEAISNGAQKCYFVDHQKKAIKTIEENCKNFTISEQVEILLMDYQKALSYFRENNITFDIVFLDPPYHEKILLSLLETLVSFHLLKEKALVIVEMEENTIHESTVEGLTLIKSRTYGAKQVNIYQVD